MLTSVLFAVTRAFARKILLAGRRAICIDEKHKKEG